MKYNLIFVIILLSHNLFSQDYNFLEMKNDSIEKSEIYINSNIYQRDFLLLIDLIQNTHPKICVNDTTNWSLIQKNGLQFLNYVNDKNTFKIYLNSVLARLNDGHTMAEPIKASEDIFYPIQFRYFENNWFIDNISIEDSSFVNKKILSINNIPFDSIVNMIKPLIPADNEYAKLSKLNQYLCSFNYLRYLNILGKDSSLNVKCESGYFRLVPESFDEINYVNNKTNSRISKEWFHYEIIGSNKVCYFNFNKFYDINTYKYESKLKNDINSRKIPDLPDFESFLIKMFLDIKDKGVNLLVVNLSNNSGGNSFLGDQLLSFLTDLDTIEDYKSYLRLSKLWIKQYPNLYLNIDSGFILGKLYESDVILNINKEEIKLSTYFNLNKDSSLIFKGKIIFIQGKKTFSSAGDLIVRARDNHIGLIAGTPSIYKPCNYGEVLFWKLPNSGIDGIVSCKYFIRPDESKCYEESLIPDIFIDVDSLNNLDEIMKAIK